MKIAIMQPYFFPYIGYFQLMAAVNRFVILDDVNYINRGWINRNRISSQSGEQWLTMPLSKASQNRLISDIEILPDNGWKKSMVRTVAANYAHAPMSGDVLPRFGKWISSASGNLSTYLSRCLADLAEYVCLTPEIIPSSSIYPKTGLRGADRIIDICIRAGASSFVNPPGGRGLYDEAAFSRAGVELQFLEPQLNVPNLKYSGTVGPVLSVLDLIMLNSQEMLKIAASSYRVVSAEVRSA